MKFLVRNNVRTTVSRPISPSDTVIFINKATTPFRDPPDPQADHILRLTLMYVDNSSTKIELVDVTEKVSESATEWRLTVERSKEDPFEQSFEFPIGSVAYLANTAEAIRDKASISEVVLIKKVRVNADGNVDPNGDFERVVTVDTAGKEIVLMSYAI